MNKAFTLHHNIHIEDMLKLDNIETHLGEIKDWVSHEGKIPAGYTQVTSPNQAKDQSSCICGVKILYQFLVVNHKNRTWAYVGSVCIKKFSTELSSAYNRFVKESKGLKQCSHCKKFMHKNHDGVMHNRCKNAVDSRIQRMDAFRSTRPRDAATEQTLTTDRIHAEVESDRAPAHSNTYSAEPVNYEHVAVIDNAKGSNKNIPISEERWQEIRSIYINACAGHYA